MRMKTTCKMGVCEVSVYSVFLLRCSRAVLREHNGREGRSPRFLPGSGVRLFYVPLPYLSLRPGSPCCGCCVCLPVVGCKAPCVGAGPLSYYLPFECLLSPLLLSPSSVISSSAPRRVFNTERMVRERGGRREGGNLRKTRVTGYR